MDVILVFRIGEPLRQLIAAGLEGIGDPVKVERYKGLLEWEIRKRLLVLEVACGVAYGYLK